MEFLLGNPFSTPVGQCLEKATDGSLQSEDWTLNMEICDIINETEEGPKDAIRALKKRLNGNRNYREVMLALTVLETCVKNCGHRFHILVANRDFIDSVLVKIISPKNNPPTIVQDKVLALIQVGWTPCPICWDTLAGPSSDLQSTFCSHLPPICFVATDLGTESVSGTLSSLQQCNPRDSFDMFAQTRGNSLAEQRKTVTYEDPQAVGGLASALDSRKQSSEGTFLSSAQKKGRGGEYDLEPIDSWLITQGMIPVAQPSVMDDIEVWLRTDLKGDDLEEGVTSEEFDKFLEERAKAAEMVPDLPSPPMEAPAPASNPSGRKKPERSEDALFAL
ncbi:TOM1-like protein 2 [Rhinopithecus roxellana]|uniref:TOM1-like protein 2 n=1 Tax=Rhinopithecus roxellana TaxID=61622 RepID=UPI0012370948|nr:TOM1-like protein 2 [Rhinopithecus roxellana]